MTPHVLLILAAAISFGCGALGLTSRVDLMLLGFMLLAISLIV